MHNPFCFLLQLLHLTGEVSIQFGVSLLGVTALQFKQKRTSQYEVTQTCTYYFSVPMAANKESSGWKFSQILKSASQSQSLYLTVMK